MCLRGLPGLPALDAVGKPASLAQRWTTWKAEFELHVTALQISNLLKRELFYFSLLDPDFNSYSAEVRGGAKGYDRALDSFSDNFKHRTRAPMARQTFLAAKPLAGETINNLLFVCRNSKCVYEAERANQVRDRASSFIKDRNLQAKLYQEETLSLTKVLEIVTQYRDKEVLFLVPEGQENNIRTD